VRPELTPNEQKKQELYRDARFKDEYDEIWQSVNKCVFCDLNDKYIFFEENGIVMTISLFAYIDGHFMIIPRRHVKSAKELSQLEWDTVRKFTYIAKKLLKSVHGINGMQLLQKDGSAAQSTVDHFHFHCIPFDSPDLCQWNYRELKYTPLQNVSLYKQARKKIIEYNRRYEKKYKHTNMFPLVCDLIALNTRNEVLLQERKPEFKFSPDYLSLPGGHVDDLSVPLEQELAREVYEETGLKINPDKAELVKSQVGSVTFAKRSEHLNVKYDQAERFIWNVYLLKGIDPDVHLRPGDDSAELFWVPLSEAMENDRVSPGIKQVLKEVKI